MIATWMVYTIAMGAALSAAAWVAEHALRALRLPCRGAWVAAIALSFAWPAAALWRQTTRAPAVASSVVHLPTPHITVPGRAVPNQAPTWYRRVIAADMGAATAFLDAPLLLGWGLASFLLLAQLARAVRAIRRGPVDWRPRLMDGMPVLVSRSFGPAVVGFRDFRIVVPEWVLDMSNVERAFVLRHEEEHRSAADPSVLIVAAIAAVIVPWNPCVWFQARRLRLAIELDCDSRVLRHETDLEGYAALLLSIAERRLPFNPSERLGATAALIVAALTAAPSNLERRITAMTAPRPRHPVVLATTLSIVVAAALVLAAQAPLPAATLAVPGVHTVPPRQQGPVYRAEEVDRKASLLATSGLPAYPAALTNSPIEGRVLAHFIVAATGRVERASLTIDDATLPLLAVSVRSFLDSTAFSPGMKGGRPVRQIVDMPFAFPLPTRKALAIIPSRAPTQIATSTSTATDTAAITLRGRLAIDRPPPDSTIVQIRSISSPFENNAPLYVVDGVPISDYDAATRDFRSLDIVSISVIRGVNAVGRYGSRAANGVILITSKAKAARDSTRTGTDTLTAIPSRNIKIGTLTGGGR